VTEKGRFEVFFLAAPCLPVQLGVLFSSLRLRLAEDYDETAYDLEAGALEIRHAELLQR
jgi:hypothetical protein